VIWLRPDGANSRSAVIAAYNHATYLPERRKMMQAWADQLAALRLGAKVLPFRAG
jgi:hypothetical protein